MRVFLFEFVCVDVNVCESIPLQLCVRECTRMCVSKRKRERVSLKPRSGSRHSINKTINLYYYGKREKKRGNLQYLPRRVVDTNLMYCVFERERKREGVRVCVYV